MIYTVVLELKVSPSSNIIPADESLEYLHDLFHDVLYDIEDITLLSCDVDELPNRKHKEED